MDGLTLSRRYFECFGLPMLSEQFPELLPFLAVGLCGSGSECFGFDDQVSRDHDFEPGFCIFLPDESIVDRRQAFLLERGYAKLPGEFMGVPRSRINPVGGSRHGVIRTSSFFLEKTGTTDGLLSMRQWLTVPEYALAEAVNGSIFLDNYGEVTRLRHLLSCYPEDIRRKKLSGHLLLMAQSGQYNYPRCIAHSEKGAAQLAVIEFVNSTMSSVFLLNRTYQPFYKWKFRMLRTFPGFSHMADLLEHLLTTGNTDEVPRKQDLIEELAADIILELQKQNLTGVGGNDLEQHAWSVQNTISDGELRNLHILAGV